MQTGINQQCHHYSQSKTQPVLSQDQFHLKKSDPNLYSPQGTRISPTFRLRTSPMLRLNTRKLYRTPYPRSSTSEEEINILDSIKELKDLNSEQESLPGLTIQPANNNRRLLRLNSRQYQ